MTLIIKQAGPWPPMPDCADKDSNSKTPASSPDCAQQLLHSKGTTIMALLHMNSGQGEANYSRNSQFQVSLSLSNYSRNSQFQQANIHKTKQILKEAVKMLCSNIMTKTMNIADLGCSSGSNSLLAVTMILDAVQDNCNRLGYKTPEFHVFLNDLSENDFNTLFKIIPTSFEKLRGETGGEAGSCFVCGCPGSFYGRLFPTESMHLFHSASSLHWLSKVPSSINGKMGILNKGNIMLGKTSPSGVFEAYLEQFRTDFLIFLKSRSQEIIPKGCMVLSLMGRITINPFKENGYHYWDIVADALRDMVEEGIVEEAKMDCFNMPYYEPHTEEVRKVIEEEGSFGIICLEESAPDYDMTKGKLLSLILRPVSEPMLSSHFGPAIIDGLFERVDEKFRPGANKNYTCISLSLSRK